MLAAWRGPVTGTKFPLTKTLLDMIVRFEGPLSQRGDEPLFLFLLFNKKIYSKHTDRSTFLHHDITARQNRKVQGKLSHSVSVA